MSDAATYAATDAVRGEANAGSRPGPQPERREPERRIGEWQRDTLPLMVRMLVGLTACFLLASCAELALLHRQVLQRPTLDVTPAFALLRADTARTHADLIEEARLRALVLLEASTLERHYHQASALLLARVWKEYLGFVTGMTLALVGAAFVLGKLDAPPSELGARGTPGELSFKTASPGLMLAVLGVILMVTTLVTHNDIVVRNAAVYLRAPGAPGAASSPAGGADEAAEPPPLERPK